MCAVLSCYVQGNLLCNTRANIHPPTHTHSFPDPSQPARSPSPLRQMAPATHVPPVKKLGTLAPEARPRGHWARPTSDGTWQAPSRETRQVAEQGHFTCVIQRVWVGSGFDSQSVEQFPERTCVTPQLRSASLTSNPLYMASEEDSRNLGGKE